MKYYIKKYQKPYEPLNKNYPEEVMKYWWQGDDKKFREAVKNYDNYYGTILPEAEITASKTTPAKTSDWTSEHNVAEDNKKYEQAHQAESQKIASAVSNKMNEVGNTIGTTALIGGMTIPALVASPVAFAGGMLGGILGAKATDKIVDWGTNGKYNTWSDWLVDKADTKYINHNIAEILNPGALVGGTVGGIFTKPAASWAYRNGKYAYNTKFKGVAKGGDMSEYVPQTIKNQVEAGVEGTRNQLKELGVDKLPYSKVTYENSPIYDSHINGVGDITIGFDSKTLKNPFKFYKAYTGSSKAGLNYGFVGGHEYAHNVHTRQFKYFNPDGTPITHPQTGEQVTVYTGVHRDYPIVQQNLYKTANGPIPKEDTYYTAPDQFLEIGLFSDINTPRVNIMKGLPNTPTSRAHLRAPMEMDADLYALKNLGYIKNGKVTDEGVNFLMKRHNLTKEGVINTIDDLQLIGYGNAISGSPINTQFRPTNQILPTSSFAESAPQTARILPTSKLTEAERFGLSKHDRTNDKKYGNLVFIRNVGLHDKPGNLPYMTKDGKVLLTNSENAFVNLTTDIPFRTHGNYSHRPGGEFMIINPRAFRGKSFISLDPSDSFLLNDNLQINPKHITVITGNKQILKSLAEKGFNVRTSPKLQLEYKRSITPHSNKKGIRLEKDGLEVTPKYTRVVDDYIDKYIGRPSIEDYIKLNQITNVDPHVSQLTNQLAQLQILENLKKLPLSESKNYIDKVLFEYPDKTKLYLGDILYEGPYTTTLRTPYKNVFFNPTSTIEFDFTKSLNLEQHPKNISQEQINSILNYIQQHNITPLKKQGGPIHIKEKNKGKFTESAKRAGKSVQEHARDTINNPKATKLQKKRAQFALNAKNFKH